MEAIVNFITGHSEDHQQMETDDGQGKRFISRDEWIKTLPDAWRYCTYAKDETKLKEHITYFEHLLKGYQENIRRLETFAGEDEKYKKHSKARFLSDLNDEEYDEIVLGMVANTEVRFSMPTVNSLRRKLDDLIQKCLAEKRLAIDVCENIAEIEGKPDLVDLKAWQFLPWDAREYLKQQKRAKEENQDLPNGLLSLIKSLCKLKDENTALKRDVDSLCRKNMNIEMDRNKLHEKIEVQEEQLRRYNSQAKSKELKQTHSLLQQISHLQEELAKRQRRESALIEDKRQLQKEKESLLTRLSEVAGKKLTQDNPAITDLSDENRPIKLSEKFSQMYDDEWTDSLEEIISLGIDEKMSIGLLLQIVMSALQLCKEKQTLLVHLPECKEVIWCENSNQPKSILSIEMKAKDKEDLQRCTKEYKRKWHKFFIKASQEKFLPEVIKMIAQTKQECRTADREVDQEKNHQEQTSEETPQKDVYTGNFSKAIYKKTPSDCKNRDDPICPKRQKRSASQSLTQPSVTEKETPQKRLLQSASADFANPDLKKAPDIKLEELKKPILEEKKFSKILNFAEHCIELCWWMQSVTPPVHLDCSIPQDGKMAHEFYKAYTKSGKTIDYIVWPVMFLHENGPLLSKGVAQPV